MTKSFPLITIGFTCFNAQDTIRYAVNSALKQTWKNFEILIVDDGSQDNSLDILNQMQEEDPRIRYIAHQKNKGTAEARNTIAKNAKGEFLTFFDDDDESTKDRLEKQYNRIISYENKTGADIVYCYCDRAIVKPNQEHIDHIGYGIGRMSPEPYGTIVADYILWRPWDKKFGATMGQMGSGTMMMRTSSFEKTGYFDPDFRRSAEIDLAVRASYVGAHFISVPEPLLIQHKTQTLDKKGNKPLHYNLLLRHKNKEYLKSKKVYLSSLMTARSNFYLNKKKHILGYLYMACACLSAPHKLMFLKIKNLFN